MPLMNSASLIPSNDATFCSSALRAVPVFVGFLLLYKDVIKRLETLAKEDKERGAAEAGRSGMQLASQPRLMSRTTLRSL